MRELTIQFIKEKLRADESTKNVLVFSSKSKATIDMCWILPNGYKIDCSCFDHSDIAETIGFGLKAALNRGWIRKGDRGAYHFIKTPAAIATVEKDILKDMANGYITNSSNFTIDLGDEGNKRGVARSYLFDKEDYEINNFHLEKMMRKKYQVYPRVPTEDIQTYR